MRLYPTWSVTSYIAVSARHQFGYLSILIELRGGTASSIRYVYFTVDVAPLLNHCSEHWRVNAAKSWLYMFQAEFQAECYCAYYLWTINKLFNVLQVLHIQYFSVEIKLCIHCWINIPWKGEEVFGLTILRWELMAWILFMWNIPWRTRRNSDRRLSSDFADRGATIPSGAFAILQGHRKS